MYVNHRLPALAFLPAVSVIVFKDECLSSGFSIL
jgi:hypothetical protein